VLTVNVNKAIKVLLHKKLSFIACVKNKSYFSIRFRKSRVVRGL
jgi:hypothetical protein